jgi:uncharacterized membrane protein YgcG
LAFFVYFCILLRFLEYLNNTLYNLFQIIIFILNFQRFFVLLSQTSANTPENITYFSSDDDDDDDRGHNTENDEDDSRAESPEETRPSKRPRLNHEDDEDNSNNSNNDSDSDDLEKADVTEVNDHNAPEEIIDDLDLLDKARKGDPEALDEIKREYPEFFRENSDKEGLKEVEEYLDSEFEPEHRISELEADVIEQNGEGNAEEGISNNSNNDGSDNGNNSSGGTGPSGPSGTGPSPSSGSSGSSGSNPGPSNSSSSDPGPSNSSSSDPGPSNSSGGGGNFSKIFIILGVIFETIAKVLEDLGNFL